MSAEHDAGAPPRTAAVDDAVQQSPVECVADRFPPLPTVCPAHWPERHQPTESCASEGMTCLYLLGDGAGASVGELSCHTDVNGHTTWTLRNAPCDHECPGNGVEAVEVDASDCEQRPIADCTLATTEQAEVDLMLGQLVDAAPGLSGALYEDHLSVEFENGCPRRFHTGFMRGSELLVRALGQVRWDCALSSPCGQVDGPSSIQ